MYKNLFFIVFGFCIGIAAEASEVNLPRPEAAGCPHLEGAYLCPKIPSQDEIYFEIERTKGEGNKVTYVYHYEEYPDSKTTASPEGHYNEKYPDGTSRDTWAYCLGEQLVMFKSDSKSGWIQQTLNERKNPWGKKDIVIRVRGKEFLRCPSVKPRRKP